MIEHWLDFVEVMNSIDALVMAYFNMLETMKCKDFKIIGKGVKLEVITPNWARMKPGMVSGMNKKRGDNK